MHIACCTNGVSHQAHWLMVHSLPMRSKTWLKEMKETCEKTGHLEVAMSQLGQVLIYAPPDPDGLWIHKTVAEALNAKDSEEMRRDFSTGVFNSRGVVRVDPSGKPEDELAAKYKAKADEVEAAGSIALQSPCALWLRRMPRRSGANSKRTQS